MRILRLLSIICAALAATLTAGARTAAEAFAAAPDTVIEMLSGAARLDMIDYFNFGSDKTTQNALGGNARITAMTDRLLCWQLSDSTDMQLAVLTERNDTLYALVETIKTPAADSEIRFYDRDWKPARPAMELPARRDWLTEQGRQHADSLQRLMPFDMAAATFDPATLTLTLRHSAPQYLPVADAAKVAPWLRPEIVFINRGTKLVRQP